MNSLIPKSLSTLTATNAFDAKMDRKIETKNQHFLAQVKQRLNMLNPNDSDNNKRIYKLSVIDRETYTVKLYSKRGTTIRSTLNLHDLFSFNVLGVRDTKIKTLKFILII